MDIQKIYTLFAITLAASMQATTAMGMPPATGNSDVSPILGIKSGSTAHGAATIDLEALKAASNDSLVGAQAGKVLNNIKPERIVRGAKEAQLYKHYSRTVVLIVTRDGLGTGSLINSNGDILTNWHVVRGFQEVGVVFKPVQEGMELKETDVRRAKVIKVDEVSDLALISVGKVPAGIDSISLGDIADIAVGSDVHAIGHPTGEAWTYTRGVVSQIRQNYEWSSRETKKAHHAHVIQTQTPINPGNSGGPLLSNDGKLVGVNSFKAQGEGLNFAIAVDEVKRFIASSGDRLAENATAQGRKDSANDAECKAKAIYEGPSEDDTMEIRGIDLDCDGKADAEIRTPFDIRKPIIIVVDENKDSKPDTVIFDTNRDGKWDYSLRDTNFDGAWDLECEHEDGGLEPTRCVPYRPRNKTKPQ